VTSFSSGVVRVLKGSVLAQVIAILALPLISRAYPPQAFGQLQLLNSLIALGLVGISLRYEIAILQEASDEAAVAIMRLCWYIIIAISTLVALVCAAMSLHSDWLDLPSIIFWFLPLGVFVGGLYQALGYLPLRLKNFDIGPRTKVVQVLVYSAFALLGSVYVPNGFGLIGSDLIARLAALSVLVHWCVYNWPCLLDKIAFINLKQVARAYSSMPKFAVVGGLINSLGASLVNIMMFKFFDSDTVGQFALVDRAMMFPVGFIVGALSQVFISHFSQTLRSSSVDARAAYRQIVLRSVVIGFLPSLLVFWSAPYIFPFLFGSKWGFAGQIAMIMTPLMFASFVSGPVNMAILLAGRQKVQMLWEISRLITMLSVWGAVSLFRLDAATAIGLYSLTGVAMSVLYLFAADYVLTSIHRNGSPYVAC
jgi:O-antigen/teichoic acid export membrane protein